MSTKKTQCEMILAYMKENGSITPEKQCRRSAVCGLPRAFASRICEIKRTHKIKTERVTAPGRFGPVTFARYSLEQDESRNLTAEQVRAMTPAEVRENYGDILLSMQNW